MFKVLVHVCQEARCKPLIHVIQTSNRSLIFTQELILSIHFGMQRGKNTMQAC